MEYWDTLSKLGFIKFGFFNISKIINNDFDIFIVLNPST